MNALKAILTIALLSVCLFANNVWAQEKDIDIDILDMSLEDLMNMEVTSVSKKSERLQDVASSIYVLSAEDIMKTGATTLHEVLRTVPGYWGVQDEYSSVQSNIRVSPTENSRSGTVLYLLDGTPIQDQMSSSFSFRNFDIPLSEIARIEVIRGSGGTIYGANSATGVVNIFTKNPGDYDGIKLVAEAATPGYVSTSLHAGGNITDKLSMSVYTKLRYFNGFESLAGKDENGNQQVSKSRFTQNYDQSNMTSMGLKMDYNLSEKTKLSLRSHFNALDKIDYSNYYTGNSFDILSQSITSDELVTNKIHSDRLTANLRLDHNFSENHSLFFRISTNRENDFKKLGGGYSLTNQIYDFELQDNVSIGKYNDFSIGGNYRAVNIDIHDINNITSINFINPQAKESLKGAFAQNKVKLFDSKLNVTLGIKAENYSLVNNEYYYSPMAKIAYIPTEKLTFWGGYTQSFTTPGFTETNIDLTVFQSPSLQSWTQAVTTTVYSSAYDIAHQTALEMGAPENLATSIAKTEAEKYVSSTEGQETIATTAAGLIASYPTVAVKNGSQTTPTKFQTWEAGFRSNLGSQITLESNFFYTNISDGISQSPDSGSKPNSESPTQLGRFYTYYFYGNYVKGVNMGLETLLRYKPMSGLSFELAHSWQKTTWEYQTNDDFDISKEKNLDQTTKDPRVPEHMFKFRTNYDLTKSINVNIGIIYASKYFTQDRYRYDVERYKNIVRNEPTASVVAKNSSRTIVNIRVEKKMKDNHWSVYAFGNDIFNKGIVANTDGVFNVTLSQISAMYGLGINYKLK